MSTSDTRREPRCETFNLSGVEIRLEAGTNRPNQQMDVEIRDAACNFLSPAKARYKTAIELLASRIEDAVRGVSPTAEVSRSLRAQSDHKGMLVFSVTAPQTKGSGVLGKAADLDSTETPVLTKIGDAITSVLSTIGPAFAEKLREGQEEVERIEREGTRSVRTSRLTERRKRSYETHDLAAAIQKAVPALSERDARKCAVTAREFLEDPDRSR